VLNTVRNKMGLKLERRQQVIGILFSLPAILYYSIFFLFPLSFTAYVSLHKWTILGEPEFIGLSNYVSSFSDPLFWNAIKVSLYYAFGVCIPIWGISLGMALLFNCEFKFKSIYLTLFFIPPIIGLVQWSLSWMMLYHPTFGVFNRIIYGLGYRGTLPWLTDPTLAMPAMIILSVVHGTPYYTIILLAAIRGFPRYFYEVAKLGGANFI